LLLKYICDSTDYHLLNYEYSPNRIWQNGKSHRINSSKKRHTITCRISTSNIQDLKPAILQIADVAIEFTQPDAAPANIKTCILAGLPVISGTTGWNNRKSEIETFCMNYGGSFCTRPTSA
jgi:4-hydroxy-tetrahydrodipicolinate reductase